jgi:hypothetical protein
MVSAPPVADANAMEAWILGLPPRVRATLQARLTSIVQGLPPVLQLAYIRHMAQSGHPNPVPLPTQGLDGYVDGGLGQWGALVGALITAGAQAGTSVYEAKQSANLQKQLQSNALASTASIDAAQTAAAQKAQAALISAQQDAAKIAGGAEVTAAQVQAATAPEKASEFMWIGGGVIALALLGIVAIKSRSAPAA